MRIQEPSTRQPISNSSSTTTPTDNPDLSAPQTIHEGQGTQGRIAREGDTYIAADGTTITLKVDPLTGVLGWNQLPYIDFFTNTVDDTGFKLEGEGAQVILYQNGRDHSGMLIKGAQGMFTRGQWHAIADATKPKSQGAKDGEIDSTGFWRWNGTGALKEWSWTGPRI